MDPMTNVMAVIVFLATFSGAPAYDRMHPVYSVCTSSERVNGTTVDMARKSFLIAGYRQLRDLKKSCDSVWHARATKDGEEIHVALTPAGDVLVEVD